MCVYRGRESVRVSKLERVCVALLIGVLQPFILHFVSVTGKVSKGSRHVTEVEPHNDGR